MEMDVKRRWRDCGIDDGGMAVHEAAMQTVLCSCLAVAFGEAG